jgi:hypothetical protein
MFWMEVISDIRWQSVLPKIEDNQQAAEDTLF